MSLIPFLHQVAERRDLTAIDAQAAMQMILAGETTQSQIAAFLMALRMKGECVDELVGFARAMRRAATPLDAAGMLLDTCGTGGDGDSTFNISTIAAFVIAGCKIPVAKHGNRSISSRCGSADLMEALGVKIKQEPEEIAEALRDVGIAFLFAPAIHMAMKHAQPVRAELKMRTVFNLLGPLTNPAGAAVQLVGAPSDAAAELMAGALAQLGLSRGLVVHGSDGLDEVTTTGPTMAFQILCGRVTQQTLEPKDFGVPPARMEDLTGGDVAENRDIALRILDGEPGPKRDIVLVNASAALVAYGFANDFKDGMAGAARSIDSGGARGMLDALVRFTNKAQ